MVLSKILLKIDILLKNTFLNLIHNTCVVYKLELTIKNVFIRDISK